MKWAGKNSISYCVKENKACIGWVNKYFQDCLCNSKDELSFAFGFMSLVFWGVAEIPQIITNFRNKSGSGVSLLFLLTWIAGDIFNLAGCVLEPATLPTQLYTAVFYTITTVVLFIQSVYYDYYYRGNQVENPESNRDQQVEEDLKNPLFPAVRIIPNGHSTTSSLREAYYYMSARSLAGSFTPPKRSYLRPIMSGPSTVGLNTDSSDEDNEANPIPSRKPKAFPRSAGYASFLAAAMNMPRDANALVVGLTGRKLLQEHGSSGSIYGMWLGWIMAVIYMGGRIPQIRLNIKRGNSDGLNPLMFVIALFANVTYMASILTRSTEWHKMKSNMPWLLDAAGCILLDLFIFLQYVYFRYFGRERSSSREDNGDYNEIQK